MATERKEEESRLNEIQRLLNKLWAKDSESKKPDLAERMIEISRILDELDGCDGKSTKEVTSVENRPVATVINLKTWKAPKEGKK